MDAGTMTEGAFCLLLSIAVLTADQAGKRHSRRCCQSGRCRTLGPVMFRNLRNYGMAFGVGAKHPSVVRWGSLVLILLAGGICLQIYGREGCVPAKIGMALFMAGAVSNTWDRFRDGYVTDYLSVRAGPKCLRRMVFNLGDAAILLGAVLTAINLCVL